MTQRNAKERIGLEADEPWLDLFITATASGSVSNINVAIREKKKHIHTFTWCALNRPPKEHNKQARNIVFVEEAALEKQETGDGDAGRRRRSRKPPHHGPLGTTCWCSPQEVWECKSSPGWISAGSRCGWRVQEAQQNAERIRIRWTEESSTQRSRPSRHRKTRLLLPDVQQTAPHPHPAPCHAYNPPSTSPPPPLHARRWRRVLFPSGYAGEFERCENPAHLTKSVRRIE